MSFNEQIPDWQAPGTEPPESKKTGGFAPGEKPPADYFNWLFTRITKALSEIRSKAMDAADFLAHKQAAVLDHPDGSVKTQHLSGSAVTAEKITPGAIGSTHLGSKAVTTAKIADGAVGSAQLASSLSLTGTNTAPTPTADSNSTQIATTAFIQALLGTAGVGGGASTTYVADLNAIPISSGSGFYTALGTTLHTPVALDGAVIHIARDSRPSQLFLCHTNNTIYYRGYTSGGWQPWISVLTSFGSQTINGALTAGSLNVSSINAIGSGDLVLDDTSNNNPLIAIRIDGVVREQIYHDRALGKLGLRVMNPDGSVNQTIYFAPMDGVTPGAMMQFAPNLQYLVGTGFKAAIDLNNSDIIGGGNIFFADDAGALEGLFWLKTGATGDSTTLTDYTVQRVDGAGVGWIGSDRVMVSGSSLPNAADMFFDITDGEKKVGFRNNGVSIFGMNARYGTSDKVGGRMFWWDYALAKAALLYIQNANGTSGALSTQAGNVLDDGAGNASVKGALTVTGAIQAGAGGIKNSDGSAMPPMRVSGGILQFYNGTAWIQAGKRAASGTTTLTSGSYVTVGGLAFTPSKVFVLIYGSDQFGSSYTINVISGSSDINGYSSPSTIRQVDITDNFFNGDAYPNENNASAVISGNSFTAYTYRSGTNTRVQWFAYE